MQDRVRVGSEALRRGYVCHAFSYMCFVCAWRECVSPRLSLSLFFSGCLVSRRFGFPWFLGTGPASVEGSCDPTWVFRVMQSPNEEDFLPGCWTRASYWGFPPKVYIAHVTVGLC